MQIIAVQHTQAEHHLNGMVGGSSDWPLTALGHNQARRIAAALREALGERPDFVLYASDMTRTAQTAAPIAEALRLPVVPAPELRELKMGSATGKSKAWLNAHKAPMEGTAFLDYRPLPDAESWREMRRRVAVFAQRLEAEGRDAIVVAHGGSLGEFVGLFLQLPESAREGVWYHGSAGGVHRLERITAENGRVIHVMRKFNEIVF